MSYLRVEVSEAAGVATVAAGAHSGTSSCWGRGPRQTAGGLSVSANFTSRPRLNDADLRGGLRRLAPPPPPVITYIIPLILYPREDSRDMSRYKVSRHKGVEKSNKG
jgi:hypothetical protein